MNETWSKLKFKASETIKNQKELAKKEKLRAYSIASSKIKDTRINASHVSIKEYAFLLLLLAAFSGLHMWIYHILEQNGIFEASPHHGISILMVYVLTSAFLVTAVISLIRYLSWTRPIKKLSTAAREIAKGDFSIRISSMRKDGKKDIVEVLFDDFNAMTEELSFINENLQNLVNEKTLKIVKLQNAILKTMSDLVEYRDYVTGGHIERTQNGVQILLEEIKKQGLFTDIVLNWDISLILQSSQLHDIGKIAISDHILKKPGLLTKDEYDEMKTHTAFGLQIIERIEKDSGESELLNHAKVFALNHHEKWDGTGYPNGLQGETIPLEGRIMAIADVYDALVSERPYKNAFIHEEAVKIILDGKGTQFDPALIDLFANISDKYK